MVTCFSSKHEQLMLVGFSTKGADPERLILKEVDFDEFLFKRYRDLFKKKNL